MAKHVQIIALAIKGYIIVDRDMGKQLEALTALRDAHTSGDYSKVIAMATIDAVKAEQKSRRFDDAPAIEPGENSHGSQTEDADALEMHDPSKGEPGYPEPSEEIIYDAANASDGPQDAGPNDDEDVPAFLKGGKKPKSALSE
ncbi:hypothetical protein [Pleomorphomonas oryzae]|uniref:hypothetical protein n=1 Tax=Pleomorphomonas oryzae TaxID=261934 RepID=UPI0003FF5C76|nr:hypothetical protein [Pleomorphomonas oryzae]